MTLTKAISRKTTSYNYYGPHQSTPASARVFNSPALLGQIILQLDSLFDGWGPAKRNRNQALLWAAQTSKAFFQPAVNVLWETLSSLLPILGVLPQFRQSGKYYTLVGQISDENWNRFDMYSRRVRIFKCGKLQDAVGKDVYIQIARLHPKPLFPLLREMEISTISGDSVEDFGPLFHCLSSKLTSVTIRHIEGERGEMLATSFISALCRESFGLRHLTIDGRISGEAIQCLARIHGLRTLKLFINSPMIRANIEGLMNLPGILELLTFTVEFGQKGTVMKDHGGVNGTFSPFIDALRVMGTSEQINQVFDILPLSDPALENITLEILDPTATINSAPWRRFLHTLKTFTIEAHVLGGKVPLISLNDLKPIGPSNLVTLSLKNISLRANHDDFLGVFESGQWNNLRNLCLPCIGDINSPCSLSVQVLDEICRRCPKLEKLMLSLDLRLSDEKVIQKALKSMKTSTHGLTELKIQSIAPPKHNGFHQGVLLAQYIDALFPDLEHLGAYDDLNETQKDYWAGIWEAVKWSQEMKEPYDASSLIAPAMSRL